MHALLHRQHSPPFGGTEIADILKAGPKLEREGCSEKDNETYDRSRLIEPEVLLAATLSRENKSREFARKVKEQISSEREHLLLERQREQQIDWSFVTASCQRSRCADETGGVNNMRASLTCLSSPRRDKGHGVPTKRGV